MQTTNYMIIFDLDDTLYKEIDFLKSAYRVIADNLEIHFGLSNLYNIMYALYSQKKDVFQEIIQDFRLPLLKEDLLSMYRNHVPHISLSMETKRTLDILSSHFPIGLITDGRSITQRNKIHSLDLMIYLRKNEHIIISEEYLSSKPSIRNYRYFQELYPGKQFVYVGDNVEKDFVAPNGLGWTTVCLLDDGRNIHGQSFEKPIEYLPQFRIKSIEDIFLIL